MHFTLGLEDFNLEYIDLNDSSLLRVRKNKNKKLNKKLPNQNITDQIEM